MLNHATIQGRLVEDPELRTTQSGVPVSSFRVAWSEKYGENETKLFLSCTAWRGIGEMISKHFHKGKEIVVEGKLSTRTWEKDGERRSTIEMTVDRAHFCGPKDAGSSTNTYSAVPAPQSDFQELTDDDGELPF